MIGKFPINILNKKLWNMCGKRQSASEFHKKTCEVRRISIIVFIIIRIMESGYEM